MDTLRSDFHISVKRLAELHAAEPAARIALLLKWHRDDRRQMRRGHYQLTYKAVTDLHSHRSSLEEIRERAHEWQITSEIPTDDAGRYRDNARATTQYLDAHADRQLIWFEPWSPQAVRARVRIDSKPQLHVLCGTQRTLICLECRERYNAGEATAQATFTHVLAREVWPKEPTVVEVVHSAARQIDEVEVSTAANDATMTELCELVHRVWSEAAQSLSAHP